MDSQSLISHLQLLDPEPEEGEDAPEAYADLAEVETDIRDIEKDGLQLRQPEEYAWIEAWRFFNGKHWMTWREDGTVQDIDADDSGVPRIVLNFILTMVQTRLGHLVKNRPIINGLPVQGDERSRNSARLATQAMQAYWRKLKLPKKLRQALLWAMVCGKGFWKVWYDPAAGKETSKPGPLLPVTDEEGKPLLHPKTGQPIMREGPPVVSREGELRVDVAFPHEIILEPGFMDLDEAERLVQVTYVPISRAKQEYGLTDEEVAQAEGGGDDTAFRARRNLEGLDRVASVDTKGKIAVRELWCKPCEKYPQGLWAISCGGRVRKAEPLPKFYGGELPFVEFDEIKTNSFWSTSMARQLLDINRIINIEVSQQEHQRRVLRYKTLVPEQANVDDDAFDERDDEVVKYWAPYAPSHLKPPEIQAHSIELRNSFIHMIKEIGGNWDVLAGKTSGEVRSGRQTAYLQEYAGTVLGLQGQQTEEALEKASNMMLRILQATATEEKLLSYVGPNKAVQVVAFKGADLQGCAQMEVQPGSALPMSRAERLDRIERWMERGWLDPKLGVRIADLGDYDQEIFGEDEVDRVNADTMVEAIRPLTEEQIAAAAEMGPMLAQAEGMMPSERYVLRALKIEAFAFDNHEIHVKQIRKTCQKTAEYRAWSPAKRAVVDALVEWHAILADPNHGPVETPVGAAPALPGARIPPGSDPSRVEPPPGAGPSGPGGPPGTPSTGGPQALAGRPPPGGGGIGAQGPLNEVESGQERADGLPGVPKPPGPNPT